MDFPPLSIGLGCSWCSWRGCTSGRRTRSTSDAEVLGQIFALNFAIGVATGIVMEFEFGTNWAAYSRFVGDVFGSALAAEGIFAFFLESGFLAVLVFGWDRVGPQDALLRHRDGRARRASSRPSGSWWPTPGSRRRPATSSASIVDQRPGVHAGRDHRLLGDGVQPVERAPAGPHRRRRVSSWARSSS